MVITTNPLHPQHMIRSKRKEVKDKNFAPSDKRSEREAKLHPEWQFNLSLP